MSASPGRIPSCELARWWRVRPRASDRYQRRDRPEVMRGGRCVDEVRQDRAALQHAGLACRADPLDPAAPGLRLSAELDLAHDHAVAQRAFGGVVGRVDAGNLAERPQRRATRSRCRLSRVARRLVRVDQPPNRPPRAGAAGPSARRAALDRDRVWIEHHGSTVASYPRSYKHGIWQPVPRMRPEPPPVAKLVAICGPAVVPPALEDYAEFCA